MTSPIQGATPHLPYSITHTITQIILLAEEKTIPKARPLHSLSKTTNSTRCRLNTGPLPCFSLPTPYQSLPHSSPIHLPGALFRRKHTSPPLAHCSSTVLSLCNLFVQMNQHPPHSIASPHSTPPLWKGSSRLKAEVSNVIWQEAAC